MCVTHTRTLQLEIIRNTELKHDTCIISTLKKLDQVTYKHSYSVANIAVWFAESSGCDIDLTTMYYAGLYHDIGKYYVDSAILNKPSKLDEKEFEIMKKHPDLGYKMLKDTGVSDVILDAVRFHHEKYNGGGYPLGLVGEEIPVIARMIHICDVYDALTSDRPYRKGYSPAEALNIMKEMQAQFDPVFFKHFISKIQ